MEENTPLEQAPATPAGAPEGITAPLPAPEVKVVDRAVGRREAIQQAVQKASAKNETPAPEKSAAAPSAAPAPSDKARDPATGKFVPKEGASVEAPKRAYPKSWNPSLQPHWEKLPAEVLDQIEKREADIFKGIEEYKAKAFPDDLKSVLAPYENSFKQQYGSTANGIKTLLELSNYATRDPQGFIRDFAAQRGIQLNQAPVDPNQPASEIPPAIQQEMAALRSTVAQLQQHSQQAALTPYLNEIERFKSEPGHEHFEELRPQMHALISAGSAKTLQEAYEQARRAHPTHSQTWFAEQQETARKAEAERAAQARAAAVQVTGAPSQATPPQANPKNRRAVIEAAVRNLGR